MLIKGTRFCKSCICGNRTDHMLCKLYQIKFYAITPNLLVRVEGEFQSRVIILIFDIIIALTHQFKVAIIVQSSAHFHYRIAQTNAANAVEGKA